MAKWHPAHGLHRGFPSTLGALCPCLQKQTRPWPLGKSALSRPCLLPQFHPLLPHSRQTPVVLAPKIFFMVLFSSASPLGLPLWWPQTSFYHLIWGMTERVSSSNHIMANQIWDSFGRLAGLECWPWGQLSLSGIWVSFWCLAEDGGSCHLSLGLVRAHTVEAWTPWIQRPGSAEKPVKRMC